MIDKELEDWIEKARKRLQCAKCGKPSVVALPTIIDTVTPLCENCVSEFADQYMIKLPIEPYPKLPNIWKLLACAIIGALGMYIAFFMMLF